MINSLSFYKKIFSTKNESLEEKSHKISIELENIRIQKEKFLEEDQKIEDEYKHLWTVADDLQKSKEKVNSNEFLV